MKERLADLSKETLVEALSKFLGDFFTPAFGSMPKREIELAVFELLQSLSVVEGKASLYELMTQLRITRAKAAQLLFDIEVRRLGNDELKSLLAEALVSPRFAKDGEYFVLEIENPLVHAYLKEKLRKLSGAFCLLTDTYVLVSIVQQCVLPHTCSIKCKEQFNVQPVQTHRQIRHPRQQARPSSTAQAEACRRY